MKRIVKEKILEDDSGAIIVEASLSLVFFVFAMLIMFSMYHVTLAQARLSSAINETAKEISQYSYLYALTSLNEKQTGLTKAGADADKVLDTIADYDYSYWQSFNKEKLFKKETLSQAQKAFDKLKSIFGTIKNSDDFIGSLLSKAANEAVEAGKGLIIGECALQLMKKHLGSDPDGFLKRQGVEPIGAMNFAQSRFFAGGTDNKVFIDLNYQVRVLKLLNFDMKLKFELCAMTCAWTGVN